MLKGIVPALLTPFTERYEINEKATRKLVNKLIDSGVHGIFALGTNGEFFHLSKEEKLKLVDIVIDEAGGRVPVAAGSGGNSTKEVIELSSSMEKLGIDALSIITPYFEKISQQELINHFNVISSECEKPIILYNMPSKTGISLTPDTIAQLSKNKKIVGVKDSSGNFENILQYISCTNSDFSVLAGTDSLIFWTLMAGGNGAVAATANVCPEICVSIYNYWEQGEYAKAQEQQTKLKTVRDISKTASVPAVYKKIASLQGIDVGPPRLPVLPVNKEQEKEIKKVVKSYEGVY